MVEQKNELREKIEKIMEEHDLHFTFNQPEYEHFFDQILSLIEPLIEETKKQLIEYLRMRECAVGVYINDKDWKELQWGEEYQREVAQGGTNMIFNDYCIAKQMGQALGEK